MHETYLLDWSYDARSVLNKVAQMRFSGSAGQSFILHALLHGDCFVSPLRVTGK
jgi:hypothetical protein